VATVSSGSSSERFGFIEKHKRVLGVKYLCAWLEVSRSGFYAWRKRPISQRAINDVELLLNIKYVFNKHNKTYGSPRVFHALKRAGFQISEKRVARLMRESGLRARALKTYSKPAKVKFFYKEINNNRKDICKPNGINQQWSSRRVIGWAFGKNKSTTLTLKALQLAINKRKPTQSVLFHTDRGAEYRAHVVQQFLVKHNITSSMNRPGCCTDNAEVESFFHSLKADIIRGNIFETSQKLHAKLKGYMNYFYNRQRLHSSLGYRTPVEYELAVN